MPTARNNERLLETCMAILQATSNQKLGITLLNKSLFYADLIALQELGHTLTDSKYLAFERGPIVADYKQVVVAALTDAGWAVQESGSGMEKPVRVVAPLRQCQHLTQREIEIATNIAKALESKAAWAVSLFSHENPGWQAARARGNAKPINMLVALQQLAEEDDDPWLSEPADEEVRAALQVGAADPGEPF